MLYFTLKSILGFETFSVETFEGRSGKKVKAQKRSKDLCWPEQNAARVVSLNIFMVLKCCVLIQLQKNYYMLKMSYQGGITKLNIKNAV